MASCAQKEPTGVYQKTDEIGKIDYQGEICGPINARTTSDVYCFAA